MYRANDPTHLNIDRAAIVEADRAAPPVNDRMHSGVYRWLFALNVIALLALWGTFRNAWEALFMIVICAVYVAMYFGTPYVMLRSGKIDMRDTLSWSQFLRSRFDTYTGAIKGWEAAVQVCLIPAATVLAFSGFWLVLSFVR